jgi:hypothetical protein
MFANSGGATLERASTDPARTLSVATCGTLLVLAVFSAFVVTAGDTARSLHAGVDREAWALSGMSLGLATALLTAGALADDVGHRRVLMWSAGLLAASLDSIGCAFPAGAARGTLTVALLAAAVFLLGAFAAVELTRRRPLLDPGLFVQPQFIASIAGALFTGLAVIGLMSYSAAFMQRALHVSVLGSATVLAAWSATSMVVALAARSLPGRLRTQTRLVIGPVLTATGEIALTGLGTGASWARLLPGLFVATLASDRGENGLIHGWNMAALVSAGLCAVGALIVASSLAR